MPAPLFIGDELTAAGFRLAGLRVLVPSNEPVAQEIMDAIANEKLVLIAAGTARALPWNLLRTALMSLERLVVVVPDAAGQQPPDLTAETHRALDIHS